MPEFGEILAELRQDKGMTPKDLAVMLNVAKSSISNYETGQRRAHTELICKAAKVFSVSKYFIDINACGTVRCGRFFVLGGKLKN